MYVINVLHSPLFAESRGIRMSFIHFQGFFAQRFGNNLVFSKYINGGIECKNSYFKNFLEPVLNVQKAETDVVIKFGYFNNCRGTNGGAVSLGSGTQHNVTYCNFINCRADIGGAVYSLATNFISAFSCFYLCCQGSVWPHYGSSIYSKCTGNQIADNIYTLKCPNTNEAPWHDQIAFYNGKASSTNINTSHCGSQYNAGIEHCSSVSSTCSNIMTTNNIAGNVIGFYSTPSSGIHRRIGFVNNTSSKGHFYFANTYLTFSECVFLNNTGVVCFTHSGVSPVTFYDCLFDSSPNWGSSISSVYQISTSTQDRTMIPFNIFINEECRMIPNEKCTVITCKPMIFQCKISFLSFFFLFHYD